MTVLAVNSSILLTSWWLDEFVMAFVSNVSTPGMVGLAPKWVRLATNWKNPGLFKIIFQYFWLGELHRKSYKRWNKHFKLCIFVFRYQITNDLIRRTETLPNCLPGLPPLDLNTERPL